MRRLLAALVLVAGAVLVGAAPAHACDCSVPSPEAALASADLAFVGTLLEQRYPEDRRDDMTWVFAVEDVLRGEADELAHVRSPVGGAACGLELLVGDLAVVYARDGRAHLCNGTRTLAPDDPLLREPDRTSVSAVLFTPGTPLRAAEPEDDRGIPTLLLVTGAVAAVSAVLALRARRG